MKKLTQIMGLIGGVILVLGGGVWAIQQRIGLVALVHLGLGAGLAAMGVLANLAEIKEALRKRSVRIGPQVLFQAVFIVLILFFLNILVFRHDLIKDLTYHRIYTLQAVTREVLAKLPGRVEVLAFFPGGGPPEGRQRLELYAKEFPDKVELRFVDPDKNEALARAENIPPELGVKFKYQGKSHWINNYEEGEITNSFIIVTRTTAPKIWFTTGHGEPSLEAAAEDNNGLSQLQQALKEQGFETKTVDLDTLPEVPPEVDAVALIGPSQTISEHEWKALDAYLGKGGNALIFLDPVFDPAAVSGLEQFLQVYGVRVVPDLVFDPESHLARDDAGIWVVATDLPSHPITDSLTQPRVVFYLSRSLEALEHQNNELELGPLVKTSAQSYHKLVDARAFGALPGPAEKNRFLEQMIKSGPGPDSPKGSLVLAYVIVRQHVAVAFKEKLGEDRSRQTRLVVAGTTTIARNLAFNVPYNYEFVVSSFNWLAGEKDLKAIQIPQPGGNRLDLDQNRKDIVLIVLMILPELFAVLGLAVWWRRR